MTNDLGDLPARDGSPGDDLALLRAVVALTQDLALEEVLAHLVATAAELTGASCAAINVLDGRGLAKTFFTHCDNPAVLDQIKTLAMEDELVAQIPSREVLVFPTPASGLPPGQSALAGPIMAVAVQVRQAVFAHLFVANKPGGFGALDRQMAAALASAVGVAIENAQLFQAAQRREHWLSVGTEITTLLLSGVDEEEALGTIARRALEVAGASTAVLVLPSVGGQLVMEIAEGIDADELIGTRVPAGGRSAAVLSEGIGMVVDSLANSYTLRLDKLRRFGPALYAPLWSSGRALGVMLLLRQLGEPCFDQTDLTTAESFASQAALALMLSEARHAQDFNSLAEERERIARDLHDLAIQQLFATGMHIDKARQGAMEGATPGELEAQLSTALDTIDQAVTEIRSIVSHLRQPEADEPLVERLQHEASSARTTLGFAPSLVLLLDGQAMGSLPLAPDKVALFARLINPELADDLTAVAREGLANAARHAKASSVSVTVSVTQLESGQSAGQVTVLVDDDGVGLPKNLHRSSGLVNLERRAHHRHGYFKAAARLQGGTRLHWEAPLT
ncbi:MAG: histidine kinase [Micrococcales bacterium]|nr:histidine kinase [Micrococcales bacterium]